VEFRQLAVPHAFAVSPVIHRDERGSFLESFRADHFEQATGRRFELRQTNVSVSKYGVGRGIHWADVDPAMGLIGQAKYVTVAVGSVVDFIVDIRVGSPTFGHWDAVELDDQNRSGVFLAEGIGHLFVATSDTATVTYLTNDVYRPGNEHGISPLDPALALRLPVDRDDLLLAEKDAAAPMLQDAAAAGLLPDWQDCLDLYATVAI
jgi:dTDP-4-dehydrorhamnose 3,5-epimerase